MYLPEEELKSLGAERAEATGRLVREEAVRGELQQRLAEAQEERAELGRRLEEEGEIHSLQRSETEAHIKELKVWIPIPTPTPHSLLPSCSSSSEPAKDLMTDMTTVLKTKT